MRVPKELLHSVSSLPSEAPKKRRVARPPWAERAGRSLGDAPSIGAGVGVAALTTWFLAGSLPTPRHTSVAVPAPQSAAHAVDPIAGAFQPIALAEPTPAGPQADQTPAPRDDHADLVTVRPTQLVTAPSKAVASPKPTPTQSAPATPTPAPTQPTPTSTPTQPSPSPGAAPSA
jgi:hypothetical protein